VIAYIKFGCNISLTEGEEASVQGIFRPLMMFATLVNDYFSWEKEHKAYMAGDGKVPLIPSVVLLMRWHGITAADAKLAIRENTSRQTGSTFASRRNISTLMKTRT